MKSIILLLCFLAISQSFAESYLTRYEESNILRELDNICGDTWCGGDFNFSFNEIKCDSESRTCELLFEYIYEVYDDYTDTLLKEERVDITCSLIEIENYDSMISNRGNLANSFYSDVTDCFDENLYIAYDTFDMD